MSLLDPSRFSMKNQYSMSYSSGGGSGTVMGMYLNTMEYRFNMPLVMRLKVAYQMSNNKMFGMQQNFSGPFNNQYGKVFVPSFDIVYKPWKNMTMSFHYRDYNSSQNYGYGGNYGYGNGRSGRYRYSPFMRY